MSAQIQIIISGIPGTGKTTIAKIIKEKLESELQGLSMFGQSKNIRIKIFEETRRPLKQEQLEGLDLAIRTTTKPI